MKTNRFLMAVAAAASLCGPISGANACITAFADTSAVAGGGSVADTSAVAGESGVSGIKAVVRGSGSRERSESTAFLSSCLGTGVLVGAAGIISAVNGGHAPANPLFITGYVIGPSIGHFYAGRAGRAFVGLGIRSATLLGMGVGLLLAPDERDPLSGNALVIASLVAGGGSALVDIVAAPHSARIHNSKVRRPLAIIPAVVGGAPGVRVGVRM